MVAVFALVAGGLFFFAGVAEGFAPRSISLLAKTARQERSPLRAAPPETNEAKKAMLYDVKGPTNTKEEGLPWWWDGFWALPFTEPGAPGQPLTLGDTMRIFKGNIEQIYGDAPSFDGTPLAEGDISGLADGTMYLGLHEYAARFGPVYKLCFGPKSFVVIADHAVARHVLRDNARGYDKGVLAEILEDIMGKGLIPADPVTWKQRRRAIVPAFHRRWLDRMVVTFAEKSDALSDRLKEKAVPSTLVDMEERFGSLALDIIGSAVFNYDFGSVDRASPVVTAAIETLREAEHRSMTPAPYWKIPGASLVVPRQAAFRRNMDLLNRELNNCIDAALRDREEADIEQLEQRDYSKMENPSLLRFLVDARGEETSNQQLRDDLMTMLIAGHETTASALTWCLFELAQQPELLADLRAETAAILGGDGAAPATLEAIQALELTRLTVAESLRMYPQPPLLIRRALDVDDLPAVRATPAQKGGSSPEGATTTTTTTNTNTNTNAGAVLPKLPRACDIFIAIYSIHRSARYWEHPDTFDPRRFLRAFKNPDEPDWNGFDPTKWVGSSLYPNEIAADFAYLPFGGGSRKCVGDQFAMMEATVALAAFVNRFDFEFAGPTDTPDKVGTNTGATIHTRNGLWMKVTPRY